MEKKNYNAPSLEQVRVEAEMPVICASVGNSTENFNENTGQW